MTVRDASEGVAAAMSRFAALGVTVMGEERARAHVEAEERRAEWERRRAYVAQGLPAVHVDRVLNGALEDTEALRAVQAFAADPAARRIVLAGGKGCGKTLAAVWALMNTPPGAYPHGRYGAAWPAELHPRFIDASELATTSLYDREAIAPLKTCRILVIDDLGIEYGDQKGVFASLLDSVFDARYRGDLRTILTTNLNAAEFKARYSERIVDRLREAGTFVESKAPSLRRKP